MATKETPAASLPPAAGNAQVKSSELAAQVKPFVAASERSKKAQATLKQQAKSMATVLGRLTPKLDATLAEIDTSTKPPTALRNATKQVKAASSKTLRAANAAARQGAAAYECYRSVAPSVAHIVAELDRGAKAARDFLPGQRAKAPDAPPKRAAWQPAERTKPPAASAASKKPGTATTAVTKAQSAVGRAVGAVGKLTAAIDDAAKANTAAQRAVTVVNNKLAAATSAALSAPKTKPSTYQQPRALGALAGLTKSAEKALAAAERANMKVERQLTALDKSLDALDVALTLAVRAAVAAARAAARPALPEPPAKKQAAKKQAAEKQAAKPPAKKQAAKKPAAKKPAAKKAPAKKPPAKKQAVKKPAAKRTPKVHLTSTGVEIDGKVPRFDKKFLTKQKNKLLAKRQSLTDQMAHLEREDAEIRLSHELGDTQFSEESGEGDSSAIEHDNIKYISAIEQENVVEIDRALERIKDGTYGYSLQSGGPIPIIRLEAIPEATLMVGEKSSGGVWN